MLKRLLLSVLAGLGVFGVFFGTVFALATMHVLPTSNTFVSVVQTGGCILALVTTGVVFMKVKTKNTMVEDIAINKLKIMKAEQEEKLSKLSN